MAYKIVLSLVLAIGLGWLVCVGILLVLTMQDTGDVAPAAPATAPQRLTADDVHAFPLLPYAVAPPPAARDGQAP